MILKERPCHLEFSERALFQNYGKTFQNHTLFLLYFYYGSISPLNYPWTSQRAPKPCLSRISNIISVLFECSVCRFIHWQVLRILFIIVSALLFLSLSVIPFMVSLSIQYPPFGLRPACFWKARAPTVSRLGLGFVRNSCSLYWILGLLNRYSRSSRSGGSTLLSLKEVRRTPKHIRNPLGSSRQRNSQMSFWRVRGDFWDAELSNDRSLKIS